MVENIYDLDGYQRAVPFCSPQFILRHMSLTTVGFNMVKQTAVGQPTAKKGRDTCFLLACEVFSASAFNTGNIHYLQTKQVADALVVQNETVKYRIVNFAYI